jgi:hypothetical protein
MHAFVAISEAFNRSIAGLASALASFAPVDRTAVDKLVANMREIIGPPSKRFMWRHLAHEAIRTAEEVGRMKPPTRPSWLIRMAPWARIRGMILPRGRRRTRAWS